LESSASANFLDLFEPFLVLLDDIVFELLEKGRVLVFGNDEPTQIVPGSEIDLSGGEAGLKYS
jgi:hypothetical protein